MHVAVRLIGPLRRRSLERLSKEPELLRADQDQLRRQAQARAVARNSA